MHYSVQNLLNIENNIKAYLNKKKNDNFPKIIAVSKTFSLDKIIPLVNFGHIDFGENKVQEAMNKWSEMKEKNQNIKLHMIGKLQSNKVRLAVKLFDYIHSVDSEKLAKKISDEQLKIDKKIKIFIQVNIGEENQKSGVDKNSLNKLITYCRDLKLNLIGLMCIPPLNIDTESYFNEMSMLNKKFGFFDLSMGMSADYIEAVKNSSTFLRIGSSIFGQRI